MAQTVHLKLQIDGNDIIGESSVSSLDRADTIECSSFLYRIKSPRNAGGKQTGRRQHKPIKITKRVDQTTPLLLKALCNNEIVDQAEFNFYRPNPNGTGHEEHFFTVLLENAYITSVTQQSEDEIMGGDTAPPMLEEVEFVFQEITWTYESNGASHHDGFRGRRYK